MELCCIFVCLRFSPLCVVSDELRDLQQLFYSTILVKIKQTSETLNSAIPSNLNLNCIGIDLTFYF